MSCIGTPAAISGAPAGLAALAALGVGTPVSAAGAVLAAELVAIAAAGALEGVLALEAAWPAGFSAGGALWASAWLGELEEADVAAAAEAEAGELPAGLLVDLGSEPCCVGDAFAGGRSDGGALSVVATGVWATSASLGGGEAGAPFAEPGLPSAGPCAAALSSAGVDVVAIAGGALASAGLPLAAEAGCAPATSSAGCGVAE
jgi:hypothetical protein